MMKRSRFLLAGITLAALSLGMPSRADALRIGPITPEPKQQAQQAEMIVIGKVTEIEKDTVDYSPVKDGPKVPYKIAVLKIQESLLGATGLTQLRVGFMDGVGGGAGVPAEKPLPGGGFVRPLPAQISGPVALTANQEGCFFLTKLQGADFYVLAGFGGPLNKKDDNYAKQLEEVKQVVKVLEDPVAALKSKELQARYDAALLVLQRYNQFLPSKPGAQPKREAIPAEENKLILALLKELPWQPDNSKPRTGRDPVPPNRASLWYMIQPNEHGFKQPPFPRPQPGQPQPDFNKIMDDATSQFLKDNGDKITIKRFVNGN
jgi:hypothetical protein